jgi:hypothetical protein
MARVTTKHNPRTAQVFQDLENFLAFCKEFGYVYDEKDLYSTKSYIFRHFQKFQAGKPVKDNWEIDASRPPRRR